MKLIANPPDHQAQLLAAHVAAMTSLLGTEGWDAFCEAMAGYAHNKAKMLRRVDLGEEGRPPDDYLKGYLDALDFVVAYPRHVHNVRTLPPG